MRLIDADELLEELRKSCKYHAENSRELSLLQRDINIVKEQPTADAVPVRHGKWLPENRTMDAFWVCSCCGFPSEAHGAFKIYKYCPNCGARMDEE